MDTDDWREAMRKAARPDYSGLQVMNEESLSAEDHGFPVRIPQNFLRAMRDSADPMALARQVLPDERESEHQSTESKDPVGDLAAQQTPGLIHKYRGRALLITTGACAIHCRYCFRREFPYSSAMLGARQQEAALNYLRENPDIHEIILSGGDPLTLSSARLRKLVASLAHIDSLRRLRIHSRIPVVLPERIDAECVDAVSDIFTQKVMVIHANHADEINDGARIALQTLKDAGWTLLNQAVLLKGVNDSVDAQVRLAERCMEVSVLPYYLHVLDRVRGSSHLWVPDSDASALLRSVRERLSGYLVPRLVRETAGAPFKVPLL